MSATDVAKVEAENARLAVALDDSCAALGKTRTAPARLQAQPGEKPTSVPDLIHAESETREVQVELYVTPTSPYARLAMIARLEKGLDEIDLVWARTRNPDDPMLAFNPSGRVPFLRLDDGTGFEDTDVIVDYMDALAPPLRFAPPKGEACWPFRRRQATARSMLDGVALWAREFMRPEGERSPMIVEHERRRAARLADFFEAEIDAFSGPLDMPQLLCFCALDVERRLPAFDWRARCRGLVAWHARVASLPSVAGSLAPAGV